jgi:hypothetical protein
MIRATHPLRAPVSQVAWTNACDWRALGFGEQSFPQLASIQEYAVSGGEVVHHLSLRLAP